MVVPAAVVLACPPPDVAAKYPTGRTHKNHRSIGVATVLLTVVVTYFIITMDRRRLRNDLHAHNMVAIRTNCRMIVSQYVYTYTIDAQSDHHKQS